MNKKGSQTSKHGVLNSVKSKLIAIMLLVAIVPLSAAVTISYFNSTEKAKEDAQANLMAQANFIESEVNTVFIKNERALTSIATSPYTIAFLKGEEVDVSMLKAQLEKVNQGFGDENSIVISDKSGMMVLRNDDSKLVDISERGYWQKAIAGEVNVSDIFVSKSTGHRDICIAVPIYDNTSNEVIGVIHRSFTMNALHELMAEQVSADQEAFVVDYSGILAAHSSYEISGEDEPVSYSESPYMTSDKTTDTYISMVTGTPTYVSYVKEPFSGYTVCVAERVDIVTSEARASAMTIVIIGIVMLVAVLIISVIMANSFTSPIIAVNKLLSELANGKFTTIDKHTNRRDEFGQMVNNSNSVVGKLSDIVGHIKASSNTVGDSSEELSSMASQIAATTETVAEAVQEIAAGASEQAKEVQNSAENSTLITEAVEGVQGSANDLNSIAEKMKKASETSSDALSNFHETSEAMTTKISDIAEKISATQNAVADINEKVEGISGIAAQTNLLSLNASIEAARAGEAGRGFAVVAEEIRKLADSSESLAQEIYEVMNALLSQSKSAVDAANQIIEDNKQQQLALAETIESVNGMLSDIEETVVSVEKISGETETCVSSNKVVANAMQSLSAISEENAAATETTGASVEELSATVSTLADSAVNLKEIAEKLNEEMSFFQ